MELTTGMRQMIGEQRLGFVATVGPDGRPNLSPKGTMLAMDDGRLLFADVASPNTVANLAADARLEINVVDPIVRKGFRFRGTATVHHDGDWYEHGLDLLRRNGSSLTRERVRAMVVVEVTEAAELISPAYDDGTATEQSVATAWLDRFVGYHRQRFGPPSYPG